jgi:hypothetical protein
MAIQLAPTAFERLHLGYNNTGEGFCGYNNCLYDAQFNPGGLIGCPMPHFYEYVLKDIKELADIVNELANIVKEKV